MAATTKKKDLAALKRVGDKGTITKTKSGKYQPQVVVKELGRQWALGSCKTAEEAVEKLAAANEKIKNNEPVFLVPRSWAQRRLG